MSLLGGDTPPLALMDFSGRSRIANDLLRSIIEGDQNQVAVFSLEHFSNLTRSA